MASKRQRSNEKTWLVEQGEKLQSFSELILTLVLDALIIVTLWWLRNKVIEVTGVDLGSVKDSSFQTILWFLDMGTIVSVGSYVLSDILRQVIKIWQDIFND